MTLEISAARISIVLAFHRVRESVEIGCGSSRRSSGEPMRTTSPPRMRGIDRAGRPRRRGRRAVRSCCLSASTCVVVERMRARSTSAVVSPRWRGGERAEGADDRGQLAEPAVLREHAEEVGGRRIELQLAWRPPRRAFAASTRPTSGLVVSALKSADSASACRTVGEARLDLGKRALCSNFAFLRFASRAGPTAAAPMSVATSPRKPRGPALSRGFALARRATRRLPAPR